MIEFTALLRTMPSWRSRFRTHQVLLDVAEDGSCRVQSLGQVHAAEPIAALVSPFGVILHVPITTNKRRHRLSLWCGARHPACCAVRRWAIWLACSPRAA
ncbi:MAG: hypothetical protein ACK5NY_00750 [Burkholderiaceae bacterium]